MSENLAEHLYQYPRSSVFFHEQSAASTACRKIGMDSGLVHLIKYAECIIKDKQLFNRDPVASRFHGDDMQLLFSELTKQILIWHMEAQESGSLTAAEGLMAFSVCYLLAIMYKSKVTAISKARANALSRVSNHLRDKEAMRTLHAAGLDVWVSLLVVTMSYDHYQDQFWRSWLETLARQSTHPIESFQDLKSRLSKGIWVASEHDVYAQCVWDETIRDRDRSQGPDHLSDLRVLRLEQLSSKITIANPYVNFETLSWTLDDGHTE